MFLACFSLYFLFWTDGRVGRDSAEGHGGKPETAAGFSQRENVHVDPRVSAVHVHV